MAKLLTYALLTMVTDIASVVLRNDLATVGEWPGELPLVAFLTFDSSFGSAALALDSSFGSAVLALDSSFGSATLALDSSLESAVVALDSSFRVS